jgi:hypothetical protein
MNMDQQPVSRPILIEEEPTEKILAAAFKVLNTPGT